MTSFIPSLAAILKSPKGKKIIIAITGFVMAFFLAFHMLGNLLLFSGREHFNDYAYFLHHFFYGGGLWVFHVILLICIYFHIRFTLELTLQEKPPPKPFNYCTGHCTTCEKNSLQLTFSSRIMIWSGLTILAFLVYHLMQFTFHLGNAYQSYIDPDFFARTKQIRPDVWKMIIDGFSVWYVVIFYVVAITLLCSHISHGVISIFQTIGLLTQKSERYIRSWSKGYALLIWIGFLSVPNAILIFHFGR